METHTFAQHRNAIKTQHQKTKYIFKRPVRAGAGGKMSPVKALHARKLQKYH